MISPYREKKFKDAFFKLKRNKSAGYDNLHVSVIRNMYHELKITSRNIFSQSLSTGIFPDKKKIAKVSPIFKNGKKLLHPIIDQFLYFHVSQKS